MHWVARWAVVACSWGVLGACGEDESVEIRTRADAEGGAGKPVQEDDAGPAEPRGEDDRDDDDFDLSDSQVIERLQDEETATALCNLAGVLMVSQGATEQECAQAVERCSDGLAVVRDAGTATAPGSVPSDLSAVFDCPVTAQLVDACLSELVVLAAELGGDLSCEAAASVGFDVTQLTGAVSCAVLYLTCPDVFASILGAGAQPPDTN